MKNKAERFLKSKGINIDYAKGIDLLQELGKEKVNLVELMEQFCQYDVMLSLPSDEQIEKEARKDNFYLGSGTFSAWQNGAIWMRDRLKRGNGA